MSDCDHTYMKVTKSVLASTTELPPGTEITCQDCGEKRVKVRVIEKDGDMALTEWRTLPSE